LFATEDELQASGPLDAAWVSGKGACVRLTDRQQNCLFVRDSRAWHNHALFTEIVNCTGEPAFLPAAEACARSEVRSMT
jgi:hypothetical protein